MEKSITWKNEPRHCKGILAEDGKSLIYDGYRFNDGEIQTIYVWSETKPRSTKLVAKFKVRLK